MIRYRNVQSYKHSTGIIFDYRVCTQGKELAGYDFTVINYDRRAFVKWATYRNKFKTKTSVQVSKTVLNSRYITWVSSNAGLNCDWPPMRK